MEATRTKTRAIGVLSKGQVSLELLLIVGFLLVIMVPIIAIAYSAIYSETWRLDVRQSDTVAKSIADAADKLELAGEGASMQYRVYLPSRVKEVKVAAGRVLVFVVETPQLGDIEQVALADVNITLDPAVQWKDVQGTQVLLMSYSKGNVRITR